jgi:hypothetical protein
MTHVNTRDFGPSACKKECEEQFKKAIFVECRKFLEIPIFWVECRKALLLRMQACKRSCDSPIPGPF